MQIRGIKNNSISGHLIVVKTWMKTNETSKTVCFFEAFDMDKFCDKEFLIDILHTVLTKGNISMSDYRMWFESNNITGILILTPVGETEEATIITVQDRVGVPQH